MLTESDALGAHTAEDIAQLLALVVQYYAVVLSHPNVPIGFVMVEVRVSVRLGLGLG